MPRKTDLSLDKVEDFEKLIELIKKYPVIYNQKDEQFFKSAKSRHKRERVFDKIAKDFNTTGSVIKKKWNNIRGMYGKYLHSKERTYRNWKWASHMEYFKPYLKFIPQGPKDETYSKDITETDSSEEPTISDNEVVSKVDETFYEENTFAGPASTVTDKVTEISISNFRTLTPENKQPVSKYLSTRKSDFNNGYENKDKRNKDNLDNNKKRKHDADNEDEKNLSVVDTSRNYHSNQQTLLGRDATELIFAGYAKIIKSFSEKRQAVAKLKIAKVIMEEEFEHASEMAPSSSKAFNKSRSRSSSISSG